jgi:hypothetical protein
MFCAADALNKYASVWVSVAVHVQSGLVWCMRNLAFVTLASCLLCSSLTAVVKYLYLCCNHQAHRR